MIIKLYMMPAVKSIEGRIEDVVTGPNGNSMVRFHGVFVDIDGLIVGQQQKRQFLIY